MAAPPRQRSQHSWFGQRAVAVIDPRRTRSSRLKSIARARAFQADQGRVPRFQRTRPCLASYRGLKIRSVCRAALASAWAPGLNCAPCGLKGQRLDDASTASLHLAGRQARNFHLCKSRTVRLTLQDGHRWGGLRHVRDRQIEALTPARSWLASAGQSPPSH
jgi:hypothetical protein